MGSVWRQKYVVDMFALRQSLSVASRQLAPRATPYVSQRNVNMKVLDEFLDNPTAQEMEMAQWVPKPEPFDAKTYFYNMKRYLACRSAGFRPEEVAQAFEDYDVSVGAFSLEWVLPSPPPIHTFEEPPLIKESPDYKA